MNDKEETARPKLRVCSQSGEFLEFLERQKLPKLTQEETGNCTDL